MSPRCLPGCRPGPAARRFTKTGRPERSSAALKPARRLTASGTADEPDPAVELRVPDEALFDAGHADQDRAELAAVVAVAELRANDRLTWSANLRQVPGHLGANR